MQYRLLPMILMLVFLFNLSYGQTETQRTKLRDFATRKSQEWRAARLQAEEFARKNNLPIREELPNGVVIELQRIENGIPIYYMTENADAARTTRAVALYPGAELGLSLTGNGFNQVGVWDGGAVRTTHQEFGGRVTQEDGATSLSNHGTHVAGTMVASGVEAQARGMAYEANLKAYDWNNDESEMASAAADGLKISNHSYGLTTGWSTYNQHPNWVGDVSIDQNESYYFGFYDSHAQDFDQIAYDAPYYLIVKSAGNDRNDTAPAPGTEHYHNFDISTLYTDTHYDDGWDQGGYDVLRAVAVAKNVLVVGAVKDVTSYSGPESVKMTSFSSWGPTDDGRIKPDITANGYYLYSTLADADDSYGEMSGTSMASPNAAGTLVLLQQHYHNTHSGAYMRSATLKALVIHTADEAGDYTGPDYKFGWGLLNAKRAAQRITDDTKQNVIDELVLNNGGTYTRDVYVAGNEALKVTIAWTDPPGTPVAPALDPPDPMLVNDLDLRIVHNGTIYYPWKLDRDNPTAAATNNSENNVDNVEQVYIANPEAGTYTIIVDHDGSLTNGSQAFSIIISGIDEYSEPPQSCTSLADPQDGATDVPLSTTLSWHKVADATCYDLYFGTDGGGTATPTNIVNGTTICDTFYTYQLASNTTYYVKIVPRNNQGTSTGCETIWSFTTETANTYNTFPYTQNFDAFPDGEALADDWVNSSDDDFNWSARSGSTPSSDTGPDYDHTSGSGKYLYTESSSPNYPDKTATLLSPYFDISGLNNPTLEFWYNMYGSDMGDLQVDVYSGGQWHTNVLRFSGQQSANGEDWKAATIYLNEYKSSVVRVRFVGTTDGWSSDMAIDDFSLRGEAFHTFRSGATGSHTFQNALASIEFTSANSGDVTLEVVKIDGDPGVVGSLPTGVINVSPERYWRITELSGTADGTYNLSLDLSGMSGISDYSTLILLKRETSSDPWTKVGTNNYAGSGTVVEWTGITGGFSEFGIGGESDNSLAVTLSLFEGKIVPEGIRLHWRTESEIMTRGFILMRKTSQDSNWTIIASYQSAPALRAHGTSSEPTDYFFTDRAVHPDETYTYRLIEEEMNGNHIQLKECEVVYSRDELQNLLPRRFEVKNAFPNPFNPEVSITYAIPHLTQVEINIYDINGRLVRSLVNQPQKAGWYTVVWRGKNDLGARVSSGMYIVRVQAGFDSHTQKILLLK